MKRNTVIVMLILTSAMTLSAQQGYWTDDGGAASTGSLRIEPAKGENLAANDNWLPGSIQRSLISYVTEFSAIKVVDIENAALIDTTRRDSRSDLIDDTTKVEIGLGTAARHLLTGALTYTGERFNLHLQVTSVETNAMVATVERTNIPSSRVRDNTVIKDMAVELLGKLGVRLTDAGKAALTSNASETDELLARADTADNRVVELIYLYNAQSFDPKNMEAINRIDSLSSMFGGGLGAAIANDIEMQRQWDKNLKDFDAFYKDHLPFVLYFTPPTDTGNTTYGDNASFSLSFKVGLRWNQAGVDAMEKVMKQMDDELKKTKNKDKWGFSQWPQSSPLFSGDGLTDFKFNVVYKVVNQNGEVIEVDNTLQFSLTAGMRQGNYQVFPDCEQEESITIPNVNYDRNREKMLGSDLSIEMVSVNGIPAEQAGQIGYMRIVPAPKMPQEQKTQYSMSMRAELAKQERERDAAQRKQERERAAAQRKAEATTYPLNFRAGAFVTGGLYITGFEDAQTVGTVDFGLEAGIGHWGIETAVRLYPGMLSDKSFNEPDESDTMDIGFVVGLNYAFIGRKWILNMGGGLSFLMSEKTKTPDNSTSLTYADETETKAEYNWYFVPYFQAKFDYQIFDTIYVRIVYRADLFTGGKFNTGFNYILSHDEKVVDNIGLGLVMYIGN